MWQEQVMDGGDLPMMVRHVGDGLQKMVEEAERSAELVLAEAVKAVAETDKYAMEIEMMLKGMGSL